MFAKRMSLAVILTGALASGCSWVELTPQANDVQILKPHTVTGCERVGVTSASTKYKVGIVNRGKEKIEEEIQILARNRAVEMGGNVLVADSDITEGSQRFVVYRCY
jgi:hypothetical protein